MIASLRGTVEAVNPSSAVINVGGVGFAVLATPDTLAQLHTGREVSLFTSLVVKEDSLTLFGFVDVDEKSTFEILQTVSGIGARTALTILSVLPPNDLRAALARKDEAALTRVPGIGKKGAQRMILEIGTKLGPAVGEAALASAEPTATAADPDVLAALVNLGWQERIAASALTKAHEQADGHALSVPELLRSSLRILGAQR
ncbi:MAG: Holliday junction branch migration protein RuvA [Arcanobacterium sp.]|nr:Holliday junction branch migration protein RuvA [Arcanobacterium sp.]